MLNDQREISVRRASVNGKYERKR